MRILTALLLIACFAPAITTAQSKDKDETTIRNILNRQTAAWNQGNLEDFMKGYWKNDSLMFIGKSGVTYGYQNTLENYKKGYSTPEQMGQLKFTLIKIQRLSPEYFFVVGKWELTRTVGNVSGHYNLLFRKIGGQWVIITDHSS
ncbi:MAG: nuclear transport factor 2 family protein [Chitinophagaceae bacterium]